MARIRTIKPELPQSESMGRISRDARLTFIQLFTLADDAGRLRGNSRMLASLLFPYDDDVPGLISGWLDELEREECILRYCDESGSSYIQICNWLDHQKIDKPSPSKLPAPESAKAREDSRGLSEGSRKLAQDQGSRIKEGTKDQGPGKGAEGSSLAREVVPKDLAQAWEKWTQYILESQGVKVGAIEAEATLKALCDRGVEKAIRDIEFSIIKRCKTIRDSSNDYDQPKSSASQKAQNEARKEVAW